MNFKHTKIAVSVIFGFLVWLFFTITMNCTDSEPQICSGATWWQSLFAGLVMFGLVYGVISLFQK